MSWKIPRGLKPFDGAISLIVVSRSLIECVSLRQCITYSIIGSSSSLDVSSSILGSFSKSIFFYVVLFVNKSGLSLFIDMLSFVYNSVFDREIKAFMTIVVLTLPSAYALSYSRCQFNLIAIVVISSRCLGNACCTLSKSIGTLIIVPSEPYCAFLNHSFLIYTKVV